MSVRNADVALPAPPTAAPPTAAPEGAWLGAGFSGGLLSTEPPRPPSFGPSAVALTSEAARASSATGAAAPETGPPASQPGAHLPIDGPPSMFRPQPKLSLSARTVLTAALCSEESDPRREAGFTGASSVCESAGGTPDSALMAEAGMTSLAVEPRPAAGGSETVRPPPSCSLPLAAAATGSFAVSSSGVVSANGATSGCGVVCAGATSGGGWGDSAAGGGSGAGAGGGDSAAGAGSVAGGLSAGDSAGGGGSDAGTWPVSELEPVGGGSETDSALALAARSIAASRAKVNSRRHRDTLEPIRAGRFFAIPSICLDDLESRS
jgi:hypothetical protein